MKPLSDSAIDTHVHQSLKEAGLVPEKGQHLDAFYAKHPRKALDAHQQLKNFTTKLLWPSKKAKSQFKVLDLGLIQKAALETKDELLISICFNSYDKHSHACSLYLMTHELLIKCLLKNKNFREATILKVVGRSWEAWKRPGQTQADRTESLGYLKALVLRLFGRFIHSASALTSLHQGGFPTKQWLDLCFNVEHDSTPLSACRM